MADRMSTRCCRNKRREDTKCFMNLFGAAPIILMLIIGTIGCRETTAYRAAVPLTGEGSQEERIRRATVLTTPAGIGELRQAVRAQCSPAQNSSLEALRVSVVWIPPANNDGGPDVFLQLILEHEPGGDTEAIVNCAREVLMRRVESLAVAPLQVPADVH
jgi:hypothetical protein